MPARDKPPVFMRIRLRYPDVQTFVEKYSANISEGGMFIQSRAPQAVGTLLRFDLMLQDSTPLLKGEGVVIWVKEYDAAHPSRVHGMGVRFGKLDDTSRAMVNRITAWKAATAEVAPAVSEGEPPVPTRDSSAEPEEHESSVRQVRAAPRANHKQATLFAALLDEARKEEARQEESPSEDSQRREARTEQAQTEQAELEEAGGEGARTPTVAPASQLPAASATEPSLVASPAAAALASGDGVAVALEMAEQVLCDLLRQSGISQDQIRPAWEFAARTSPDQADAELQALLSAAQLPHIDLEQAMARLPAWAAPISVTQTTAPPPTPTELSPQGEDFDPSLLHAAARTARASKQVTGRAFDLSEGEHLQVQRASDSFHPLPAASKATPPPPPPPPPEPARPRDPGWSKLQTVTELLDHDSSVVLRDLAQRTKQHPIEPEPAHVRPRAFIQPESGGEPSGGERGEAGSAQPAAAADFDAETNTDVQQEGALSGDEPALDQPRAEPEAGGEHPLVSGGASAETLSRAVWREVVSEVAEDLRAIGTADDSERESFFDGAVPVAPPPIDNAELETAEALELDPDEMLEVTDADEAIEQEASPTTDSSLGNIFSDMDLGVIDKLNEYDSDATVVTDVPAFGEPGEFVEGDRPPRRLAGEGGPLPDTDESGAHDDIAPASDPLGAFESGQFDRAEEELREDPELDEEVLDAIVGLRDTLRDDEPPHPSAMAKESAPDLQDLARQTKAGLAAAESQAPSEPAELEMDMSAGEPDESDLSEPDGLKKSLRPRKSGILKRLFGKKE